jgi:hypothetical protein
MGKRVSKGEKILKRVSYGERRPVFPVASKWFPFEAHEARGFSYKRVRRYSKEFQKSTEVLNRVSIGYQ